MKDILTACLRALKSLAQPRILWHLLWPTLVAAMVWTLVAVFSWSSLVGGIVQWFEQARWTGSWLQGSDFASGVLVVLVKIAVALGFIPLIYVTSALLVAVVALPLMLETVGQRDYADLEQRHGGNNFGSAVNALWAALLFCAGLLVTLPLWLVPGAGLIVSVLLTAWLNQRAFRYDALMLHADGQELRGVPQARFGEMLGLGALCAGLAYVPVVNLFAPAFCGLAFCHFLLEALRRERAQHGVSILDAEAPATPRPPLPGV